MGETLEQKTYRLLGAAWPDEIPYPQPTFEQSLNDPYFKNICEVVRMAQEEAQLCADDKFLANQKSIIEEFLQGAVRMLLFSAVVVIAYVLGAR